MSCDNSLSVCESKSLAKKLKMEDPEQFQTLVRMHLSFVLDLTTEDADSLGEKSKARSMKWSFVPFTKKLKGPVKDHPEGVPLSRQVIDQVHQLIVFLTKEENVVQEGIFRRSGKMTRQQELKSMLSKGNEVCLDEGAYSVHDAASVLKTFLAELPEPLITEAYYPAYCQIAELCQNEECSKERVLCSLQLLFLLLPDDNRVVLKDILCLLNLTASHSDSNLMSAQNLATLFTPHLVCPRKLSPEIFHAAAQNLSCVVVFMITEGTAVFEIPGALATDIKAYFDRKKLNDRQLETSISEGSAAKTVYSFVDREKTAQENISNPTEMALAALYAHIQSLPESNKKKRLIKQFNKGNGPGTPKPKSLGDSIKKHLFSKNLKGKGLADFQQSKNEFSSSDDQLNSPFEKKSHRTPLSHKIRMNLGGCSEGRSGSKRRSPSLSDNDENVRPNDNDDGENNAAQTVSLKSLTEPCSDDSSPSSSGSYDNSEESETSGGHIRLKPEQYDDPELCSEQCQADGNGHLGSPSGDRLSNASHSQDPGGGGGGSGRGLPDIALSGLPVQSERSDGESDRPELLVAPGGFRSVLFVDRRGRRRQRRRYQQQCVIRGWRQSESVGLPLVLSKRGRHPTIRDREFWVPPVEEEGSTT